MKARAFFRWRGQRRDPSRIGAHAPKSSPAPRHCVNVSPDVYARVTLHALKHGISAQQVLDELLKDLPAVKR